MPPLVEVEFTYKGGGYDLVVGLRDWLFRSLVLLGFRI